MRPGSGWAASHSARGNSHTHCTASEFTQVDTKTGTRLLDKCRQPLCDPRNDATKSTRDPVPTSIGNLNTSYFGGDANRIGTIRRGLRHLDALIRCDHNN